MNMHTNIWQKARKGTKYPYEHGRKEIHKCLVAISFQGDKSHELLLFHTIGDVVGNFSFTGLSSFFFFTCLEDLHTTREYLMKNVEDVMTS